MKLNGKKIQANIEVVVLPRGEGDDLVFKARAILDTTNFDKLCPRPTPPRLMRKGGVIIENTEDAGYQADLLNYGKLRMAWMVLESLRATDGLDWETVRYEDPATWNNYEKEMREDGLAEMEVAHIINAVMTANALNETKINEARERFFTGEQAVRATPSSPEDARRTTPSGEPASDSGSDPPESGQTGTTPTS